MLIPLPNRFRLLQTVLNHVEKGQPRSMAFAAIGTFDCYKHARQPGSHQSTETCRQDTPLLAADGNNCECNGHAADQGIDGWSIVVPSND